MAARPTWQGHLKLSLVTCPVALFTATTSTNDVRFHLINPETNNRIRMVPTDPDAGPVERSDLVRGYEVSKDEYVLFDDADFDKVRLESTKTISIDKFVDEADIDAWRWMYDVNVLGLVRVTQALLPALRASGDAVVVNVGSTAGRWAYEGGGGYTAAKHGVKVVTETLRLELNGEPIRVCEVAPGMVQTDEFSLKRFGGDQARADAVYAGVDQPLLAEDVADAISWVATRPSHVDIDELVIKPRAQAAAHKVHRS